MKGSLLNRYIPALVWIKEIKESSLISLVRETINKNIHESIGFMDILLSIPFLITVCLFHCYVIILTNEYFLFNSENFLISKNGNGMIL